VDTIVFFVGEEMTEQRNDRCLGIKRVLGALALVCPAIVAAVILSIGIGLPRQEWPGAWNSFARAVSLRFLTVTIPKDPEDDPLRNQLVLPFPGIKQPGTASAKEAYLDGEEQVIGVCIGPKARAYRLRILEGSLHHVVNDIIDGVPVSVTYCNLNHCAKVFTSSSVKGPLDLAMGGRHASELVLVAEGHYFYQESGAPLPPNAFRKGSRLERFMDKSSSVLFPYQELSFERMTWKEWKKAHPETDVFWILKADQESMPWKK
jgi:hypothetical protein